jgi:serine/threonine protein kinase
MPDLVAALPKPGDMIAGVYQIECRLGRNPASEMYGVRAAGSGERYAVRCWRSQDAPAAAAATKQFMEAAQAAQLFKQPGIVEVFGVGETHGAFYAVMEWLDGISLARYLERNRGLTLEDSLRLLGPCMEGLIAAHAAGVVHGDLRPQNVFFCRPTRQEPERARLINFGFGNWSGQPVVLHRPMHDQAWQFIAPEALQNERLDPRSDVYGLGVLLYAMLSAHLPFEADNANAGVRAIMSGASVPLARRAPQLSPAIAQAIARAMACDPQQRQHSVRELLTDLRRASERPAPLSRPAPARDSRPFVWVTAPKPMETWSDVDLSPVKPEPDRRWKRWQLPAAASTLLYLAALAVAVVSTAIIVRYISTPRLGHRGTQQQLSMPAPMPQPDRGAAAPPISPPPIGSHAE